jgi:hypothetical protein
VGLGAARRRAGAAYTLAPLDLATMSCMMLGGTTSYRSSCMEYCARPLVMPRSWKGGAREVEGVRA